jgi:PhnB protein
MPNQVEPVPEGRGAPTAYLTVKNAAAAIDFYKRVFEAKELMRMADPNGRIGHAELGVGQGVIYLSDEYPEMDVRGPETLGGSPVMISLYVKDVDAVFQRATSAGATVVRKVEDQFYGDRGGKLKDPFGHMWWIATHKEDVSDEEIKKRAAALFGG